MFQGSEKPIKNGASTVSSVRKLLEKVGDLRALQFWSNQFWHFWHLLVNTKPGQIVSDYHPLILGLMYICFLKKFEIIFECLCMWSVSYSQGAMFSDKLMNLFILGMNFGQNIHNTILLKPERLGLKILLWHKMTGPMKSYGYIQMYGQFVQD